MAYKILILLFSITTIYNLYKRGDLLYKIKVKFSQKLALAITAALLIISCIFIFPYDINNYFLAIVFFLFTVSAMLVRGFNRKGVYNVNELINIARFVKWTEIKAINIAYNEEDYIDVTFVTNFRSFEHRYPNEVEKIILRIKKDLKL